VSLDYSGLVNSFNFFLSMEYVIKHH